MAGVDDSPRVAAVLGGSAGIGRAIAEALARGGWGVAVGARGAGRLDATVAALEAAGGTAAGLPVDVADAASVERFFDRVAEALGVPRAVVVCAAHARPARFWERDAAGLAGEIATGLTGALLVARAAVARWVRRQETGDLLFLSSTTAAQPWPYFTAYGAAKAGLEQAARAMALELEGTGIRVAVVRVGNTIGTDWAAEWSDAEFGLAGEWTRFGLMRHQGFMQPADVARTVVAVLETPRGVGVELVTVHPEAPRGAPRAYTPGRRGDDSG